MLLARRWSGALVVGKLYASFFQIKKILTFNLLKFLLKNSETRKNRNGSFCK